MYYITTCHVIFTLLHTYICTAWYYVHLTLCIQSHHIKTIHRYISVHFRLRYSTKSTTFSCCEAYTIPACSNIRALRRQPALSVNPAARPRLSSQNPACRVMVDEYVLSAYTAYTLVHTQNHVFPPSIWCVNASTTVPVEVLMISDTKNLHLEIVLVHMIQLQLHDIFLKPCV